MNTPQPTGDSLAKKRYMIMNALRVGSIAGLLIGLMIARKIIDAPYALGVALAVGGLLAFYFGPRALAKQWKSSAGDETR